jgi:hypothetical protein
MPRFSTPLQSRPAPDLGAAPSGDELLQRNGIVGCGGKRAFDIDISQHFPADAEALLELLALELGARGGRDSILCGLRFVGVPVP